MILPKAVLEAFLINSKNEHIAIQIVCCYIAYLFVQPWILIQDIFIADKFIVK